MTTYSTGNPVGSPDPRDLYDSSADIDTWATSTTADTHPDRLGTVRKTWRGMENEFDADQVARASEFEADQNSRETQFAQLMISGGYTGTGTDGAVESYAAGITVSTYKEIIRENGEFWRAAADTTLPYTTTGSGMPEGGAFVNVGDGVLRQDLVQPVATFNNVADMKAASALDVGRKCRTLGYYEPGDGGGNDYEIVAAATGTDDGGSFIDLDNGLQAKAISFVSSIELYVDPINGSDLNTGVSTDPFQSVQRAVAYISQITSIVQSEVTINLSEGTYPGQIRVPRGLAQRFFLKFKGPSVGGHPNTPTALIDLSADTSATRGISSSGRNKVWLEDVKFIGAFPIAADASLGTRFELRNVHIDGSDTGISVVNGSRYFCRGGIIENCDIGISELFSSTRSFSGVSTRAEQVIIRNCGTGVKAKENCSGHLAPLTIQDCSVGVELQAWSTANVGTGDGLKTLRCDNGIVLTNSEIHNESPDIYGTDEDSNGVNLLSLGNSSEIASFGWVAGPPYTVRTGHRPQVPFYNDLSSITHTGTLEETTIYDTGSVLTQGVYSVTGKSLWFELTGTVPTTTSATLLRFSLAGVFIGSYSIPAGSGTRGFNVKCHVISKTDGNSQLARIEGITSGTATDLTVANRTANMDGPNPKGLTVSAELADTEDSVTFLKGELMA